VPASAGLPPVPVVVPELLVLDAVVPPVPVVPLLLVLPLEVVLPAAPAVPVVPVLELEHAPIAATAITDEKKTATRVFDCIPSSFAGRLQGDR
jgi:hypothetical protein